MTYFAILGKHKHISLAELQYIQPQNLQTHGPVATFDTQFPDKLSQLGGIIKWGVLTTIGDYITHHNPDHKLIGTNSLDLGKYFKSTGITKQFKEVSLDHTNEEVQTKGIELINIHANNNIQDDVVIGIVQGYQNISLFETIDFQKPSAGMGIGMMPSKLALIMINIAISHTQSDTGHTIYDPFCGFGTTCFLANTLGYNTIGSDINASLIKPNLARWKTTNYYQNLPITTFKHDATTPIQKPFIKHTTAMVSEGWLGPIINKPLLPRVAHHQLTQIGTIYCDFLKQVDSFFDTITICITIPVYRFYETNVIYDMIKEKFGDLTNRTITPIPQMYERKGQYVMRQLLILTKH